MVLLLKDQYLPADTRPDESLNIAATEADDWFLIRIRGAYSGVGRSRQIRTGSGWNLRDDLNISLNLQGRIKPIRITSSAEVDADFRLIAFQLKVDSGIVSFEQKGRMEGRDLVLELPGPDRSGVKRIKLAETPRISRSLGLPAPLKDLEVGDQIRMPIFDPMDGNKSDAVISVLEKAALEISDRKVEAWRVRALFRSADMTLWVDREGRLLKGLMPLGITVIRSDRAEIAKEMKGVRNLPDFVSLAAVQVEGSIPDDDNLKILRLNVQGEGNWSIPNDGFRQTLNGTELTITREDPPKADYLLPSTDPKMEEYLASTRFLRADHPEVIKKAKAIVGDEKDPVKAAQLINNWVFRNLKKVPTPSVPDAYSVLQTLQGDCNEHAVLAVSLARAVGLPARIAVGLVRLGDGFYYHAWVNYWGGRNWFTGDPMMDIIPVKPTHITLLYGDVDKHLNVISFLGRLKLKVLEAG
ncbi:MAG: transglutaminase domain-containing protein [Desulfomonile tiedjei]|nr:transglutaminase domain-containing protein [Desulfomonile tiedjei]